MRAVEDTETVLVWHIEYGERLILDLESMMPDEDRDNDMREKYGDGVWTIGPGDPFPRYFSWKELARVAEG